MSFFQLAKKRASSTTEPITWTARTSGFSTSSIRNVKYNGTHWVAAGDSKLRYASDPTSTWSACSYNPSGLARGLAWDGTYFYCGDAGGAIRYASNASGTWTSVTTTSFGSYDIYAIASDGGSNMIACGESGKLAYSTNPTTTWTQSGSAPGGSVPMRDCAYGNSKYCALRDDPGAGDEYVYVASDPTSTWTGYALTDAVSYAMGIAYGNGTWVIVDYGARVLTATDPTSTWTHSATLSGHAFKVAYGNGAWAVSCSSGKIYTATTPTGTWTARSLSNSFNVRHIAYGSDGYWVAAGDSGYLYTAEPGV